MSGGGHTLLGVTEKLLLDAGVVTRCRRRVHLEHDPQQSAQPPAPPDPGIEQRIADAAEHRRYVSGELSRLLGSDVVEIPRAASDERRAELTEQALRAEVPYISEARLPTDSTGGRTGAMDLLVRGEDGYLPVLVVRHKITDPGRGARVSPIGKPVPSRSAVDESRKVRAHSRDQLRLAHGIRMLQACGAGASSGLGGVIGVDADAVLWHDLRMPSWPDGRSALDEYDSRFGDRLAVAEAAVEQREPLALPSRINECKSCPWWPVCEPQLLDNRDVSLVVRGEDANQLRASGLRTVDELAAVPTERADALPLNSTPRGDAVLLARAWLRDLPLVRREHELRVPRGDVEIDVDMESYADAGAYLWGSWLSGADVGQSPGYRGFASWEPLPTDDEARSFAEFWTWFRDVRAGARKRGLSFRAYCYNELAENRWLLSSAERFAGKPGIPSVAEVRRFIRSDEWVDLFAVVRDQFLCPNGKGLKVIAPSAGFAWRDPEAGGENSMRWYRDAVGMDGGDPDLDQQERLLRYNEDDVRATWTVRRWMTERAAGDVPHAAEL